MNVIPINKDIVLEKAVRPRVKWALKSLLKEIGRERLSVLIFIDQQQLCQGWLSNNVWLFDIGRVVLVSPEILNHFQVFNVPQVRWFNKGHQLHMLRGANDREVIADHHNTVQAWMKFTEGYL